MRLSILLFIGSAFAAGPVLNFQEKSFDFGKLLQGDVVTHDFAYENRGDGELTISKVAASCGCTAGEASKKTLRPGEKGDLKVTFNSEKFTGSQKKTVVLYTNNAGKPYGEITISANVKKLWSADPSHITFTLTRDGRGVEEKEIPFTIANFHALPIQYIHLAASLPELSFDRKFPILSANVKQDSLFTCRLKAAVKERIENTRYGYVDLKIGYEDGRSFTKRIGVSVKKWQ